MSKPQWNERTFQMATDTTMMLNISRIFKEEDAPVWQVAYGPVATRIWREFQRKIQGY